MARHALVGLSLATLAAYLFIPVLHLPQVFNSGLDDFDPLALLVEFILFPSAVLGVFELDLAAEALTMTWWFYAPAGIFFGLLLPRRSSRQSRSRAAMEGALLGGALGMVGGVAGVFAFCVWEGFAVISFAEASRLFWCLEVPLVPYCALWVAGFAAVHARRHRPATLRDAVRGSSPVMW
jgi:hypothetical protein